MHTHRHTDRQTQCTVIVHPQAKHQLRQSKMYTKQVETKESMLTNVQALLTKIQMAETDAMVTIINYINTQFGHVAFKQ